MTPSLNNLLKLQNDIRETTFAAGGWERSVFLRYIKEAYAQAGEYICNAQHEGAGGYELCEAHANFIDAYIFQVYTYALEGERRKSGNTDQAFPCALVAIGGYGRGELSPGSDIDLLFLFSGHEGQISELIRSVLYLMWDAGLTIGHSARTISNCLKIAKEDYQSETAMLENRLLAGSDEVFREFNKKFDGYLQRVAKSSHLRNRLEERMRRYRSWDPSVYVLEPNVKESAGGLRDFHAVCWLAKAFGLKEMDEIWRKGWVPQAEFEKAMKAYDFLLRIRAQLHVRAKAKNDTLNFPAQTEIAPALGYEDEESALASECLMRDYFLHARDLHIFCRDFFETLEDHLKSRRWVNRKPKLQPLENGLALQDYHTLVLDESNSRAILETPTGLMKIFECQYRFGCRLSPNVRNFVRAHLDTVDDNFRASPDVRDSFLRILNGKAGVTTTMHEMHGLGLLGCYIPEFEPLTCFVQYDHYHRYTADEHTLLTLAALDELTYTKDVSLQHVAYIHREMERTNILRLALLFHDIGKARGPRHVHKSSSALPDIIMRMGLPADQGSIIEFLVACHIEMSITAERRDIDDPVLISNFADKMGTVERLQMLYLLTYADISAVAPGIWNEWRSALIYELYKRVLRVMETGEDLYRKKRREDIVEQVSLEARAGGSRIGREEIARHMESMPDRYRMGTPPQDILRHIELGVRLSDETICEIDITHRRKRENTLLTLLCKDQLGLFALVAGAFAVYELNILDAKVYTREDGLVIDTFEVVDSEGKAVVDEGLWKKFRKSLEQLLSGELELLEFLGRSKKYLRLKKRMSFDLPILVEFDQTASEDATVLEVVAPDRHGLLAQIAQFFVHEGISISRAKITTEGQCAVDAFYITEDSGEKIEDTRRLKELCAHLSEILEEGRPIGAIVS